MPGLEWIETAWGCNHLSALWSLKRGSLLTPRIFLDSVQTVQLRLDGVTSNKPTSSAGFQLVIKKSAPIPIRQLHIDSSSNLCALNVFICLIKDTTINRPFIS